MKLGFDATKNTCNILPTTSPSWTGGVDHKINVGRKRNSPTDREMSDNNELHQGSNHPTISKFYRIFFPSVSSGSD